MAKRLADLVDGSNDDATDSTSPRTKRVKTAAEKEAKRERREARAAKKAKKKAQRAVKEREAQNAPEPERVSEPQAAPKALPSNTKGYSESEELSALSQKTIDEYLATKHISVSDPRQSKPALRPIINFSHLDLDASIAPVVSSFAAPTPIQAAAWPWLLSSRDVVGVAETGSGKTLAFGLPCVRHILAQSKRKGPGAVIVSPTRELAIQIQEQLVKLAEPAGLEVACIYGGVPKDDQRRALKHANIIVATPGRLNDLLSEHEGALSKAKYLVLDEADRMLDKGFEDDIRKIVAATAPAEARQTLMFTATWPQSVRDLAATFLKDPVKIAIGDNPSGELRANTSIAQTVEVVEQRSKEWRLLQILKEHTAGKKRNDRILVFCLYKKEATRVENFIRSKGFRVAGIHGDLSQAQRVKSLDSFKTGEVPLLVATDVAARGLDIPAVKLVINVTFPLTAEDYVHRIGRTGRAGQEGRAVTLFTEQDKALSGALINVLKAAKQPVPDELLKFGTTVKKKGHEAYGAFYKDTSEMKAATKITFDD